MCGGPAPWSLCRGCGEIAAIAEPGERKIDALAVPGAIQIRKQIYPKTEKGWGGRPRVGGKGSCKNPAGTGLTEPGLGCESVPALLDTTEPVIVVPADLAPAVRPNPSQFRPYSPSEVGLIFPVPS